MDGSARAEAEGLEPKPPPPPPPDLDFFDGLASSGIRLRDRTRRRSVGAEWGGWKASAPEEKTRAAMHADLIVLSASGWGILVAARSVEGLASSYYRMASTPRWPKGRGLMTHDGICALYRMYCAARRSPFAVRGHSFFHRDLIRKNISPYGGPSPPAGGTKRRSRQA